MHNSSKFLTLYTYITNYIKFIYYYEMQQNLALIVNDLIQIIPFLDLTIFVKNTGAWLDFICHIILLIGTNNKVFFI